jgi:hypothetical protein
MALADRGLRDGRTRSRQLDFRRRPELDVNRPPKVHGSLSTRMARLVLLAVLVWSDFYASCPYRRSAGERKPRDGGRPRVRRFQRERVATVRYDPTPRISISKLRSRPAGWMMQFRRSQKP